MENYLAGYYCSHAAKRRGSLILHNFRRECPQFRLLVLAEVKVAGLNGRNPTNLFNTPLDPLTGLLAGLRCEGDLTNTRHAQIPIDVRKV